MPIIFWETEWIFFFFFFFWGGGGISNSRIASIMGKLFWKCYVFVESSWRKIKMYITFSVIIGGKGAFVENMFFSRITSVKWRTLVISSITHPSWCLNQSMFAKSGSGEYRFCFHRSCNKWSLQLWHIPRQLCCKTWQLPDDYDQHYNEM